MHKVVTGQIGLDQLCVENFSDLTALPFTYFCILLANKNRAASLHVFLHLSAWQSNSVLILSLRTR